MASAAVILGLALTLAISGLQLEVVGGDATFNRWGMTFNPRTFALLFAMIGGVWVVHTLTSKWRYRWVGMILGGILIVALSYAYIADKANSYMKVGP